MVENHLLLIDNIFIKHTAITNAFEKIENCISSTLDLAEPLCLCIIGESGAGKSRLIKQLQVLHPSVRHKEGIYILFASCPVDPTIGGLYTVLLGALGDPVPTKGKTDDKKMRLLVLLKATRTFLIILDEFQQFLDKTSRKIKHNAADALKNLIDEAKIAFIVFGLPACDVVISRNSQLKRRFGAPAELPRFDWQKEDDMLAWMAITKAFNDEIAKFFDIPVLSSKKMSFRLYCASGGIIGYLAAILRQSIKDAVKRKTTVITLEDLDRAYRLVVADFVLWEEVTPFDSRFELAVTDHHIFTTSQIGKDQDEALITRPSKIKPQPVDLRRVLSK